MYPTESITVFSHDSPNLRRLYSKSEFFSTGEYFVIEHDDNCLVITKCYLEIPSKALKITSKKTCRLVFQSDLPVGTYTFDEEETNEDQLVIYLDETKIEIETEDVVPIQKED